MSVNGDFEEEASRHNYGRPYTSKHPVPTIQGYRAHRAELENSVEQTEDAQNRAEGTESKPRRALESLKAIVKDEDKPKSGHDPYPSANRNTADRPQRDSAPTDGLYDSNAHGNGREGDHGATGNGGGSKDDKTQGKSATETAAGAIDPKEKRKAMKKIDRDGGGREVTDPVTHLPVTIHDKTDKDLNSVGENEPAYGSTHRTSTGLSGASKSRNELRAEQAEIHRGSLGMEKVFPPPNFDDTRKEMARTYHLALITGLGSVSGISVFALIAIFLLQPRTQNTATTPIFRPWMTATSIVLATAAAGVALTWGISGWLSKKVEEIFDDETWDAARQEENNEHNSEYELPESVAWLNSMLASIWPLINPDLFSSLVDMLEDVMQASLPKVIRMVSVDDLGQGNEAIRILGVRWLPTGAASQSVDADGNVIKSSKDNNDRTTPGDGQEESDADNEDDSNNTNRSNSSQPNKNQTDQQKQQQKTEEAAIREGMEAEQGDFLNLELAFAYRARSSGKSIKTKAKNAHLYLKFYLPGGIAIPVWVELRGIVGTMRLRLQLNPDPPFFSLCTLTFMGQPRANLSCVPLSKHNLNLMDVPLISSFVQSAIDAALAEYVAPKSLTLDLKDMLVGDDFKKDTAARGVVMVNFKKARGFKEGDGGIGPFSGDSDCYVTLSWTKFGKPAASTRVLVDEQSPNWNEWHSILVTPDELNADERLRVQIWDSDKHTADDDLGRVEVDLKDLMHNPKTKNKMDDREDSLKGEDPDENMPGTISWSVGYFAKAHVQPHQLEKQTINTSVKTKDDLKKFATELAQHKLREATNKDESKEIKQQTLQDYKEQEDEMIISTPPSDDLRSGILSIQIHNITGLEVQKLNKEGEDSFDQHDREDDAEQSDNLPDSYCAIVINQRKVYQTRTKPKNAKPFFNAGTERFIKDWKTTEIMVSVRDSRERENDPLLGMVYFPLNKVFEKRSQVTEIYPLAGGIGYGRIRISMVWRSVEFQMPRELSGWDVGTLELKSPVRMKQGTQLDGLEKHRIKLTTNLGKVRMYSEESQRAGPGGHYEWRPNKKSADENGSVFLGVRRRYASPLVIEFRKSSIGFDSTPAFAVFWLYEIADEEEKIVTLKVWKGGKDNLKRASNCCDYEGIEENEQPLGEIEIGLKFWRGLSGYHKSYADKQRSSEMRNVMELLDTVNDEKMADDDDENNSSHADYTYSSDSETEHDPANSTSPTSPSDTATRKKLRQHRLQDSSSSSLHNSDSDSHGVPNPLSLPSKIKKRATSLLEGDKNKTSTDGERGLKAQINDYVQHRGQLHRKHRGAMQWKSARTLDWMAGKVKRSKGVVEDLFRHSEKEQGVETEV